MLIINFLYWSPTESLIKYTGFLAISSNILLIVFIFKFYSQTEERAQAAEDRVTELEEQLKVTNEKFRAVERGKSVTPNPAAQETPANTDDKTEKPPAETATAADADSKEGAATAAPEAETQTSSKATAAAEAKSSPTPPHSPSPTPGRKTPHSQSRPHSQISNRSGTSSRGSHRSKKGK